jgi:elongation factor 1-gamma
MSFANAHLLPGLGGAFRPLIGRDPYNKKSVDDNLKATEANAKVLEDHLLVNTYLVSERFTLADLFTAGIASRGFQFFWDPEWRSNHPNITRWFNTVISQDIYKAVVENTVFTEQALENKPPAGSENKNKKEKKEKKPEAAAQPKAEKKPKVKTAAEAEEEEEEAPQAPKPKHPLELLGKPTFVLDDWYVYSCDASINNYQTNKLIGSASTPTRRPVRSPFPGSGRTASSTSSQSGASTTSTTRSLPSPS